MPLPDSRCLIGTATSAAMVLASAAPALATTRHHPPSNDRPSTAQRFNVHGIVLAVNGNYVKVLTSVAKIGRKARRNKVVTFTFTAKTKRTAKKHAAQLAHDAASPAPASPAPAPATAPALAPGTDIVAAGIVSSNGTLVKTNEVSTVLPAEALIGKVSTVNADGSFIVAIHDQVDGDHAKHDNNDGVLVSTQGATVTGPALAAGA